jgi:hypothetical protein
MIALLRADADSYTWVAAAIGSNNASGYQLATGEPVMAIGGFNGTDPSPTLAQFQQYVAAGKIHYFIGAWHGRRHQDRRQRRGPGDRRLGRAELHRRPRSAGRPSTTCRLTRRRAPAGPQWTGRLGMLPCPGTMLGDTPGLPVLGRQEPFGANLTAPVVTPARTSAR